METQDQQNSIDEIKLMLIQILKSHQRSRPTTHLDQLNPHTQKGKQPLIAIDDNQEKEREASSPNMEKKLKITIDPDAEKMEEIQS